jgi:3-oxoacyl-[acyl-carrier protein] reductase
MTDGLEGQVAIITGAGRGIGQAIALGFAKAGARVGLIARTQARLDGVATEIRNGGGICHAQTADVAAPEPFRDALDRLQSDLGRADILVNNAGILGPIAPFTQTDPEAWWRVAEVNLRGPVVACHAVLPAMLARHSGRIINVVTGAAPFAYFSAYAASKTALVRFSESLSAEVSAEGVAVFSMVPGTVRTNMSEHSMNSEEGRRWIPWFRRIFDEGLDLPMERPVGLALALASGRYDALSGLTLTPLDDLDVISARITEVDNEKLYSLRLRTLPNPEQARIQALRDAGAKAVPAPLELDWTFKAGREQLYATWVDAAAMARWFIPEGGPATWNQPPIVEPHPGGLIAVDVRSGGEDFRINGEFTGLVEGRSLAFTWTWGSDSPLGEPGDTWVEVTFGGDADSCRLSLRHYGLPNAASREGHERGWIRCFKGLSELLEPQSTGG